VGFARAEPALTLIAPLKYTTLSLIRNIHYRNQGLLFEYHFNNTITCAQIHYFDELEKKTEYHLLLVPKSRLLGVSWRELSILLDLSM